jgi:hypothetical protein
MTGLTFKKLSIALALTATTLGAVAPAQAQDRGRHAGWSDHDRNGRYDYRSDRRDGRDGYYGRDGRYQRYESRGRYQNAAPVYRGDYDRRYQGGYYQCRNDGAAGTIIGAIAGGLIGNSVAGRHGDKTAGTIIGGAVGAVAGRAIDKGDDRC